VLRELPPDEQLASLICVAIERKPQAMSALVSMLAVLGVMTRHVSTEDRIFSCSFPPAHCVLVLGGADRTVFAPPPKNDDRLLRFRN
jgi:hypothetical protein